MVQRNSEPVLSRFGVMYLNEYDFSKLVAEGLDKRAAYEITISVWEQLHNPNIRICVQIGHLVKNEPDIEMAIQDEIQNFKDPQMTRSTTLNCQ